MSSTRTGARAGTISRAEAQRVVEVLDREIRLTCVIPEHAAAPPTASRAWIEGGRTFDQRYAHIDVFAKISERKTRKGKGFGVVRSELECLPSQIDALAIVGLQVVHPIVRREHLMTIGSRGEGGPVMRIAFYRLPQQVERLKGAVLPK